MPTPKPDPVAKSRGRGRKTRTTAMAPVEQRTLSVPPSIPDEVSDLYLTSMEAVLARGGRNEDVQAIVLMCQAAAMAAQAWADVQHNGLTIQTDFGPKVNPMIKIHREQSARYMSIANEYGLTLASRLRLGLMQLAGESILAGIDAELGIEVRV